MIIFNIISLLGGLAMFLYGMRLMGASLKEGSSGTLKNVLEKVTDSYIKAFLLGIAVTAIIQSSTATIVITSGLVAAGIISLDQSLGIIIGANVGTTVTGQIIRLLDVNAEGASVLRFFQPVTLAPLALIIGVSLVMFFKFKKSDSIGNVAIGFGILFSGLLNMTSAVSEFASTGIVDRLFSNLGDNPFIGYLTGAGIAFVLQSSSATIGILQAFSLAGTITFRSIYSVIVGIYLGDCVTTALVCSIGAKQDARRVGIVNILFNLSETVVVLVAVNLARSFGLLDAIWNLPLRSGGIANTNTVFNLGCAILLLPAVKIYKKLSMKIVKDEPEKENKYADKVTALNPVFFSTPALALRSCYAALMAMFNASCESINKAYDIIEKFDEKKYDEILEEEENIDMLTDRVDNYLVELSPHVSENNFILILTQYHKIVSEFEHLGDSAVYMARSAKAMFDEGISFTANARKEINLTRLLLNNILELANNSFSKRDIDAARHIEPLCDVMSSLTNRLHDNHLERLREGNCTVRAGILFSDLLANITDISDTCSNVGKATITRVYPETANNAHSYISSLKMTDTYTEEYERAHALYFNQLDTAE